MKHTVKTTQDGVVEIDVSAQSAERPKLMENLQQCQSGQCGCPTDAYDRIEDIALSQDATVIHMRLKPKDGETIDAAEVEKCLD